MKVFFEAYEYPLEILREYLSPYLYHAGKSQDKGVIGHVGYFFNVNEEEPSQSDSVFILPKVFIDKDEHPFGLEEKKPEDVIELDTKEDIMIQNGIPQLVFGLSVWIYKAIEHYKKRNTETKSVNEAKIQNVVSNKNDESETFLEIVLQLIAFHKKHRSLLTYISIVNNSNRNKIHWAKTISRNQPIIRNGKPAYVTFRTKEKIVNYDEELIVLFYSVLEYIRQRFHFKVSLDVNYELIPVRKIQSMIDSCKGTRLLKSIRRKYFTDELVALWNLLYVFFDKSERIANKRYHEETLLVKDFQLVFEDMIDYLISDENYPDELKNQDDGKIVDHIYKDKSLVYDELIYYVGDSKYYKSGEKLGKNSIAKQYTYAKNIIQRNINVWEGFDMQKDHTKKHYLPYRDERTHGYNITPNFFISGVVKRDENGYKTDEGFRNVSNGLLLNRHYEDKLFDRDTLILQRYNINFLYVLTSYASQQQYDRDAFRAIARRTFRNDLKKVIARNYHIYQVEIPNGETIEQVVHDNYWELEGKVFSFDDVLLYATQVLISNHRLTLKNKQYTLKEYNI
jgi:hypothetical protein